MHGLRGSETASNQNSCDPLRAETSQRNLRGMTLKRKNKIRYHHRKPRNADNGTRIIAARQNNSMSSPRPGLNARFFCGPQ
jgi:hypothetical protein